MIHNDLIARLRMLSPSLDILSCEDVLQAADALEAQAEENRRLREALEEAIHDADQTLMLLGDTGWRKRHRAALTSGGRG